MGGGGLKVNLQGASRGINESVDVFYYFPTKQFS